MFGGGGIRRLVRIIRCSHTAVYYVKIISISYLDFSRYRYYKRLGRFAVVLANPVLP